MSRFQLKTIELIVVSAPRRKIYLRFITDGHHFDISSWAIFDLPFWDDELLVHFLKDDWLEKLLILKLFNSSDTANKMIFRFVRYRFIKENLNHLNTLIDTENESVFNILTNRLNSTHRPPIDFIVRNDPSPTSKLYLYLIYPCVNGNLPLPTIEWTNQDITTKDETIKKLKADLCQAIEKICPQRTRSSIENLMRHIILTERDDGF